MIRCQKYAPGDRVLEGFEQDTRRARGEAYGLIHSWYWRGDGDIEDISKLHGLLND